MNEFDNEEFSESGEEKSFKKEQDFRRLGEKSFEQNFSSEEDYGNLLDFVVGLMSCASKRGIDASKLFREAESQLYQLGASTSFKKK